MQMGSEPQPESQGAGLGLGPLWARMWSWLPPALLPLARALALTSPFWFADMVSGELLDGSHWAHWGVNSRSSFHAGTRGGGCPLGPELYLQGASSSMLS